MFILCSNTVGAEQINDMRSLPRLFLEALTVDNNRSYVRHPVTYLVSELHHSLLHWLASESPLKATTSNEQPFLRNVLSERKVFFKK